MDSDQQLRAAYKTIGKLRAKLDVRDAALQSIASACRSAGREAYWQSNYAPLIRAIRSTADDALEQ